MERIGRYQIIGELGRGAMGIVYRATDPAIGRTVAIKVIRLSEFTAPGERDRVRERLFREAQSAGILSHPGIVTIYDISEEGDITCIFMECVNGPTFEKLLAAETPPSNDLIQNVFRQTAAALAGSMSAARSRSPAAAPAAGRSGSAASAVVAATSPDTPRLTISTSTPLSALARISCSCEG